MPCTRHTVYTYVQHAHAYVNMKHSLQHPAVHLHVSKCHACIHLYIHMAAHIHVCMYIKACAHVTFTWLKFQDICKQHPWLHSAWMCQTDLWEGGICWHTYVFAWDAMYFFTANLRQATGKVSISLAKWKHHFTRRTYLMTLRIC